MRREKQLGHPNLHLPLPQMTASKPRFDFRKLVFTVMLLVFIFVVVTRLGQVEQLWQTLRRGRLEWVALAVALQGLTLLNQPALYQSLYQLVGLQIRWRELVPVVWAAHFVNIVTPAAGLGGTALLLDAARRHGLDMGRVTLANTLYFLFNFIVFVLLLGFSLVMLFLWHDLKDYEVLVAAIPLLGVVVALFSLWLVAARPQSFERVALAIGRGINKISARVLKRQLLPPAKTSAFAATFAGAADALRTARAKLARPCLHASLVDTLEILVLGACFAAFPGAGRVITPAILVVGYAIGTLFLVVSVTPQGLGVVEGVMTATFVSLGVPLERAAVVVLAYRGLSFWLPLAVGFCALRWAPNLRAPASGELQVES